jgi:hypothetical protein
MTFKKLGIDLSDPKYAKWDVPGSEPGIQPEEVPTEFKKMLIDKVMNVEDLETSHSIVTDIYSNLLKNNMMGIENKDYRGIEETAILGNKNDQDASAVVARKEKLVKLQALKDPTHAIHDEIGSMTPEELAVYIFGPGGKPSDSIYNNETGEEESIKTYIAKAKNKAANKRNDNFDVNAHGGEKIN